MVNIYKKNNLTSIIVQNKVSSEDIKNIAKTINNQGDIQIAFIDISAINTDLIFLLDHFKNLIDISTNNKTLWLYLKRIGIDIKLHHRLKNFKSAHKDLKAIGIGGSAGSLRSMIDIIEKIPFCDINIFIVMHILPDQKSRLVELFSLNTKLKVQEAVNGQKVQKSTVYIAPPDLHMIVKEGFVYTLDTPKVNFCRPAIDVLFESLAKEYKESLVSVLTCGYLDDGSRSLSLVKENGGISLIQNPNQCEANDMPLNGMLTKNYDFVFDSDDIGEYLKSRLNITLSLKDRVEYLVRQIRKKYGYDFTDYDMNSLIRRVELLRQELGIEYFNDFETMVLNDCGVFEALFEKLSINVSEFFRDENTFKFIKNDLFSTFGTFSHIRIWCAGSSKGQEPYSVAMLLDEAGLLEKSIIYATDINQIILEQAKNGIYSLEEFGQFKENFEKLELKKSFDDWFDIKENYVCIKDKIKKKVHFFEHNLATDGIINEFQVVFCRNVLIYFNEKLQNKVLDLIYDSLSSGGCLVLGDSEYILNEKKFKKLKSGSSGKIFVKADAGDVQ